MTNIVARAITVVIVVLQLITMGTHPQTRRFARASLQLCEKAGEFILSEVERVSVHHQGQYRVVPEEERAASPAQDPAADNESRPDERPEMVRVLDIYAAEGDGRAEE